MASSLLVWHLRQGPLLHLRAEPCRYEEKIQHRVQSIILRTIKKDRRIDLADFYCSFALVPMDSQKRTYILYVRYMTKIVHNI